MFPFFARFCEFLMVVLVVSPSVAFVLSFFSRFLPGFGWYFWPLKSLF